jgi:phosphate-selective porin OprO/OprP
MLATGSLRADEQKPPPHATEQKPPGETKTPAAEKPASDSREQPKETQKDAEPEWYKVGSDLNFKVSWNDGLNAQTTARDFRINLGGRFDVDWGWFTAPAELQLPPPAGVGRLEDGADFRRARVHAAGTVWEIIDFFAEYGFESARQDLTDHPGFLDVYFDITQLPVVGNFRTGHFREPFGLEALQSGNGLTFMERSSSFDAFVPFRNIGLMLYNAEFDERMTWAVCFSRPFSRNNGVPFDYGDGEYAGSARVTFLPWYANDGRKLLHLGAACCHRSFSLDEDQDRLRIRAFPETRVGQYFFVDTGGLPAESSTSLGLEFGYGLGPLSLQAEYFHRWVHDLQTLAGPRDPSFHGWYAQVSYFLTGEHRGYVRRLGVFDRPRPLETFFLVKADPDGDIRDCCRGSGAWELGARYSMVDATDPSQGVDAQTLHDVTLGVKWYLNDNTYVQWNYIVAFREFAAFDNQGVAHILGMRFHIDF